MEAVQHRPVSRSSRRLFTRGEWAFGVVGLVTHIESATREFSVVVLFIGTVCCETDNAVEEPADE